MTRSSAATPGGEMAVAAGSASAADRAGAQEAAHDSTTAAAAAAHVTGTAAEWDSVGKYLMDSDHKKALHRGAFLSNTVNKKVSEGFFLTIHPIFSRSHPRYLPKTDSVFLLDLPSKPITTYRMAIFTGFLNLMHIMLGYMVKEQPTVCLTT
jgi:hypothetical protein